MTTILAIDPGTDFSAIVAWNGESVGLCDCVANDVLLRAIRRQIDRYWSAIACELIQSFGMPVGREVFATAYLIGRIQEIAGDSFCGVYRSDVKLHLCHSARAKDASIRQALIDKFGGSRQKAIGTKKQPGPLYGVRGHCWSALAVAVTWWETRRVEVVA